MQECRVCGLLFLGGGACPSCGSQVAMDITVDDIVMDDDTIPGLEEIADAIGDASGEVDKSEILPFGLGAKAEVIESSLPFGVGSFTSEVNEVAIPYSESDVESIINEENNQLDSLETASEVLENVDAIEEPESSDLPNLGEEIESKSTEPIAGELTIPSDFEVHTGYEENDDNLTQITRDSDTEKPSSQHTSDSKYPETTYNAEILDAQSMSIETDLPLSYSDVEQSVVTGETVLAEGVPDMWKIDAAEVDMEAIYSQEEQIVEVTFEDDLGSDDVQVSFDDFHHTPVEESMASDEDAPELHPAKALAVESSGQPEITTMVNSAFEHMANSSWMQAAQILSTASNNRPNDPAILNNLGLALLQSALEMDSKNDPMSSSQYEAAIMALRQGAKVDSNNDTILLNLSHALLVSGRAEKALKVITVLRGRTSSNVEVENTLGACLIQLGRDEEAQTVLEPFASDKIVSGNLSLI